MNPKTEKTKKPGFDIPKQHIIKYPNRRLYCRIEGRYITLEDVQSRIEDGRPVRVIERETGKDITRHILIYMLARLEDADQGRIDEAELRGLLSRRPLNPLGTARSAA